VCLSHQSVAAAVAQFVSSSAARVAQVSSSTGRRVRISAAPPVERVLHTTLGLSSPTLSLPHSSLRDGLDKYIDNTSPLYKVKVQYKEWKNGVN